MNVSVGGVAFETYSRLAAGSQIILQIDGIGQIPALVRWSAGNRCGARFNGKLDVPQKQVIAKLVRMSLSEEARSETGEAVPIQSQVREPESCSRNESRLAPLQWADALKPIHEQQLRLLAELDAMGGLEAADPVRLADVRLQLTRLSRKRRELTERSLLRELERASSPRARRSAARVRAHDDALRRLSAEHIGRWSLADVLRDWTGYHAASARVRAALRTQIELEQDAASLFPMRRTAR